MDIGIDVGGTFTDLVAVDKESGALIVLKVASTPEDQSIGILRALERAGPRLDRRASIVHGTTVATNAVLERKGARCGLITTRGFRDVLELRRRDRPRLYGLTGWFEPLVPRDLRTEVTERVDHRGNVLTPLDEQEVRLAAHRLRDVDVIVISFLHSYVNPTHERLARDIVRQELPEASVVISSDVLPEYREFERTSTAVVNGYIQPVVARYLTSLSDRLKEGQFAHDVLLVQSNGGAMSSHLARRLPVNLVLSGPAAGVIAGAFIAQAAGFDNCITADVGGTSFDVSLVANGRPQFAEEKLVEYGVPVRIPHIDIETIGAGGGSIAWIDRGGVLRVGPQSAGASPGPAAYGKGGTEPTVTDAQLVLGRIDPARPIGGSTELKLDVDLARQAIERRIARPLGLSIEEASQAIISVVNSNMAGSIRSVSVERGYDPRDFALVAFGGAGPLHACALMREVSIGRAVIPAYPGVTSALGCVLADFRHDFVQTVNQPLADLDLRAAYRLLEDQFAQGVRMLEDEGISEAAVARFFQADMAYEGQIHTIRVPLPGAAPASIETLRKSFDDTYRREYGHTLDGFPVMVMNLRTTVVGQRDKLDLRAVLAHDMVRAEEAPSGFRKVYFDGTFLDTPIYQRDRLPPGVPLSGPCIVEQADTTIVIEPDMDGVVDPLGNIVVQRRVQ